MSVFHPKQTPEPQELSAVMQLMESEPQQEALFQIEGPDEDGCVWVCSTEGRDVWCANLGPCAKVAEVLSQWLGTLDFDELEAKRYERANPG